ncbi:SDR family NAD(P)-dependent oxidoreductase [Thaumasiovibrio subtropicus]|uniref:SDR family NAD(P)-dependent oxidoreductase n=1 Tax=Thaumasiovibrio subtropicus TaxID=1891207 RepID=UPI000B35E461|nr:SDR family NAD(P)-dependent oxidoreductase [Thaumasiovibrio subtropicus]
MRTEKITGRTIVISGGSSGIGSELVKRLCDANQLIVLGRDKEKLRQIAGNNIATYQIDIGNHNARTTLFKWLNDNYPQFDTLINNAGWMAHHNLASTQEDGDVDTRWQAYQLELRDNLEAHMAMTIHALPNLLTRPNAVIANMTTGLVYAPKSSSPFYCAAKAGLHSFSQSLREQTKHQDIRIIEIMPPLVNTPFHQKGLPETVKALTPEYVAEQSIKGWQRGKDEIRVGLSNTAYWLSRIAPSLGFHIVNRK